MAARGDDSKYIPNATDPHVGLAPARIKQHRSAIWPIPLLITLAFMDKPFVENELYRAVLTGWKSTRA